MLRHALLLLALLPLAAAEDGLHLQDAEHDVTLAWTRGSPVLLGTPCGPTDLVGAHVAPQGERSLVTLQLRDLADDCLGQNPPRQVYGVTLNWQTPEGGEGWTRATFSSRYGDFFGGWTRSMQCPGLAPMGDCVPLGTTDVELDARASRLRFESPVAFDALRNVYVDSVMYDCATSGSGTICGSGRFVGPGDRMPDLPPVPSQVPLP